MHGSLAFDFPDAAPMMPRAHRDPLFGTGTGWVVVVDKGSTDSIAKMLATQNGYKHFFLASGNGRRCVAEGDIVILKVGRTYRMFLCGAAVPADRTEWLRNAVVSCFDADSVTPDGTTPIEMLAVGLSPFGRRERRRQESRTMLERTFDSLQCRQIIGNPYLKERLSRKILAAAPKPIDPLLNAIFSRLRADGLLGVQSDADADMGEAAVLYLSAKSDFEALQLKMQAAECERRFKLVRSIDAAKSQRALPGLKSQGRSARQFSDLGFVAKRCLGMKIRLGSEDLARCEFERREQGTSQFLGEGSIRRESMLRFVEQFEDPVPTAVVRAGAPSVENGTLLFDLNVAICQRFAATLGFDVPMPTRPTTYSDGLVGVSGRSCRQVGHPSDMDEHGNAIVRLAAKRTGRHRVELRIAEGLLPQQIQVSFQLDATVNA